MLASSIGQVYSCAAKHLGRGVPIDDMVQEGCLGVLQAALDYDPTLKATFVTRASLAIDKRIKDAIVERSKSFSCFHADRNMNAILPSSVSSQAPSPDDIISVKGVRMPVYVARMIIDELLSNLSEKQANVLKIRFGLMGSGEHTLKETAELLDITDERVRQIEARALKKFHTKWKRQEASQEIGLQNVLTWSSILF